MDKISSGRWVRTRIARVACGVMVWFIASVLSLVALMIANFYLISKRPEWWSDIFSVLSNIITGFIVSFVFYYLLVYLPGRRKNSVVRRFLLDSYIDTKEWILFQVVCASIKGGREDLDTSMIKELMDREKFRNAFSNGSLATEGFYAFQNQMMDRTAEFDEIIISLRIIKSHLEHASLYIDDPGSFVQMRSISMTLTRLEATQPGYDSSEQLCEFIYRMFTGFNYTEEYRGRDPIEKILASL